MGGPTDRGGTARSEHEVGDIVPGRLFAHAGPVGRDRLLAAALGSIATAVMVTEADGTIVWVNAAFTEMSGYTSVEVLGQSPRILKSGVHDRAHYAELWATILSGRTWRGEVVERHKQGHHYRVTQTITPIVGEDGLPTHFVAVHEDVTALRDSQARLRAVFDQALDAIVLFDDEGAHVDSNPAAAALTGYQPSDLERMSLVELIAEDDLASFVADYAEFLTVGTQRRSYRLRRADGGEVEVEFQAVADIVPGVHLAIARDVTLQRQTEAELRLQAQLLAAAGEAVIATDLTGSVVYWNLAATRLFGWTEAEAVGRPVTELTVIPELAEQAEAIMSELQQGRSWTGQFDVRHRDGSTFTALVTDSPVRDESGALAGIIGISTDISELIGARDELARLATQQRAIADLSRYVLEGGSLGLVGREAERTIVTALADPDVHAAVAWDEHDLDDLVGRLPDGVTHVDIAHNGALLVWGGHPDLAIQDHEFLHSVAAVLTVTQQHDAARTDLQHLATHDTVTGLPNRTLFLDRLDHAKAASGRSGQPFTLLFIDLDAFKDVNDGFGHDTGDEALRAVGSRILTVIRPSDTLARFGGDEFAILLPSCKSEHAALAVAARIQVALDTPITVEGVDLTITAGIGIAIGDGDSDPARLLRDADAAMYRAKADGPRGVALFDHEVQHRARQRLDLATALRAGLDSDEIAVHYQPIVSLDTGETVGVEALARWRRPTGGLTAPADFIPLAEEIGLIGQLGGRILEIACRDARVWTDTTDGDFILSVNVSPRQFTRPDFTDTVLNTLSTTGLDPAHLYLEITESTLMSGPAVAATMNQLRDRGVRFAIDDFGTGYSSLMNLRQLPLDILKIDRSFISGLADDLKDRGLVTATVDLARTFSLITIAEGIETPQQRAEAAALGCDLGQGYLWSPAVDADRIATIVLAPVSPRRHGPRTHR